MYIYVYTYTDRHTSSDNIHICLNCRNIYIYMYMCKHIQTDRNTSRLERQYTHIHKL